MSVKMNLIYMFVCWSCIVSVYSQCQDKDFLECAEHLGSTAFAEWCKRGKVDGTFTHGDKNKTLLLPNRVALNSIPPSVVNSMQQNKTFLKELLYHHLVPEQIKCDNLSDNSLIQTVQGSKVRFNTYMSGGGMHIITVNGGEYENVEDKATNGLVCVIDKFLYQIPKLSTYGYVSENRNISTFLLLAAKAQTLDIFKDPNLTLIIPDNTAFSKLAQGVLQNLTSNISLLKDVLSNHIADKVLFIEGLVYINKFTAMSGSSFPVSRKERDVQIGPAKLINGDVTTINGVVHIIDTVLLETK